MSEDPAGGSLEGLVLSHTYRINKLLSKGGMGEVYEASHIELGTRHAVKVVRPEKLVDGRMLNLFRREAETLHQVRHEAIVAYEALLRDADGRLHLVMEFLDGPSLSARIAEAPLTPAEVVQLRDRLSGGLGAAHDRGIVHRDMSPDNVILPGGDLSRAKIIDFGIAKHTDPEATTILRGDFAGKYPFASPEQLGDYGGAVDGRSDFYSLALVLVAAALGRPLELGSTFGEIMSARRVVPDLSQVPAELRGWLTAMLQPDPMRRPQNAAEVIALRPPATQPPRQPPAKRGSLIAAGGLVTLTVLIVGIYLNGSRPSNPPKPAIERAVPPLTEDPSDAQPTGRSPQAAYHAPSSSPLQLAPLRAGPPYYAPGYIPPELGAEVLSRALAAPGCSHLAPSVQADHVTVRGFVTEPDDLRSLSAALAEAGYQPQLDLRVLPHPLCDVAVLLHQRTTVQDGPDGLLKVRIADGSSLQGVVEVELTGEVVRYLYVSIMDAENVVHLIPSAQRADNRIAPGGTLELSGQSRYQTLKRDAQSMVIAVAAPAPLFDGPRLDREPTVVYLDALDSALQTTSDRYGVASLAGSYLEK